MTRPLGFPLRIAFAIAGLSMMIPANGFPGAIWTDVGGFILGVVLIGSELGMLRRAHRSMRKAT
jgi:hypothetical protein